jgi:hypothetical protein
MPDPLYKGEDFEVVWDGAKNPRTGVFLNGATVQFVLKDTAGIAVTGGSGTCSYQAASDGDYVGVLQSSRSDTIGGKYVCEVTLVEGDYNAMRYIDLVCVKRGKD